MMDPRAVIEALALVPHPEGGYYLETYRSRESIAQAALPDRYSGQRHMSTAIYYLLEAGDISALHRVQSDEVFHFYLGDPTAIFILSPSGEGREIVLGPEIGKGQRPQVVAPRGSFQGLRVIPPGRGVLLGATVAPGFDFDDFEMGDRARLLEAFPAWEAEIRRYTR